MVGKTIKAVDSSVQCLDISFYYGILIKVKHNTFSLARDSGQINKTCRGINSFCYFVLKSVAIRGFFNYMPKSKAQKSEILRDLVEKINKAKSVVFAKFSGLKVKEAETLRKELRAEKSEYYVAKKTLVNLAFKEKNLAGLDAKNFDGQVAVVFGYEDEVAGARIINKYKKELENKVDFFGGILENKFINAQEVSELANLPSKQELYAKIAGSLNAPISGFVNALVGNIRNLVYVLNAFKDKKTN